MADDVWRWCEKTGAYGRTITVKIRWQDFQLCTRRRTSPEPISTRAALRDSGVALLRSTYPLRTGVRLVGVTVSQFRVERQKPADLFGSRAVTPEQVIDEGLLEPT